MKAIARPYSPQAPRRLLRVSVQAMLVVAVSALAYARLGTPGRADATGTCSAIAVNTSDCTVEATSSRTFDPQNITVAQGVTVTWVNTSPFGHTTTSDPTAVQSWSSSLASIGNPGDTFAVTFNTIGTDEYYCAIHGTASNSPGGRQGMIGMVTVVSPSAARVAGFSITRTGAKIHARWSLAVNHDVVGFYLAADHQRVGTHLIAVHSGHTYRESFRYAGSGPFTLHTVLSNGSELTNSAHARK